eukprot:201975_1
MLALPNKSKLCPELRCDFEIELLVSGYLKRFNDQSIPEDINKLCMLLYGKDLFCWIIKTSELKSLRPRNTHRIRIQPILPTQPSSDKIESDIFSFQRVQFQLNITATHGNHLDIVLHLKSKYVYVSGTAHITIKKPYYESEKYFQFRFASDNITMSTQYDSISPTFTTMNCIDEHITFMCHINIFKIEIMNNKSINNDLRLIKTYHKKINLKRNILYKWLLKNSTPIIEELQTDDIFLDYSENSPQTFYYSPHFDKGNWRLLYIEKGNKCRICLQLISKSSNNISVKWVISVHYDNISNTWECIAKFDPGRNGRFLGGSDCVYENENTWIKEYDTKCLCIISNIEILQPTVPTLSKRISGLEFDVKEIKNIMKQMNNKQEELISMINKSYINNNNEMTETDEKLKIQKWLSLIKLPQYFDAFISNGYESLNFIKEISNKTELFEIGVELKGHQTKLLAEIKKLLSLQEI